jgi:hypothetical protein
VFSFLTLKISMAASKTEHDLLGSVIGYIGSKDTRVTGNTLPVYKGKLEVHRDTRPVRTPAQQAAVDAYLKKYTEASNVLRTAPDQTGLRSNRLKFIKTYIFCSVYSRQAKLRRRKGRSAKSPMPGYGLLTTTRVSVESHSVCTIFIILQDFVE